MPLDSSQPVQGVAGSQEVVSLSTTTTRKPSLFPSRDLPLCFSIHRKCSTGYPSVNVSISILRGVLDKTISSPIMGAGRASIGWLTRPVY